MKHKKKRKTKEESQREADSRQAEAKEVHEKEVSRFKTRKEISLAEYTPSRFVECDVG